MKKIAMYRRSGIESPRAGLKEKIIWQLSNRPMTGQQLAEKLGVTRTELRCALNGRSRKDALVAEITAGEWILNHKGVRDRLYSLAGKARRVAPSVTESKRIVISLKNAGRANEEERQKCIAAAQRRERLMAAGLWIFGDEQ